MKQAAIKTTRNSESSKVLKRVILEDFCHILFVMPRRGTLLPNRPTRVVNLARMGGSARLRSAATPKVSTHASSAVAPLAAADGLAGQGLEIFESVRFPLLASGQSHDHRHQHARFSAQWIALAEQQRCGSL